jgi:hypothetical protein
LVQDREQTHAGKRVDVAGRTPRAVIVAIVLSVLVAAGALGGAAVLRWRAAHPAAAPVTSGKPPASSGVGPSGCLREPCQVLASTTVGGTSVELVADAGGTSGRLRVGGLNSGSVIEATITEMGVTLAADSLQCLPGGPAACLIRGRHDGGIAGQVVVGRSDSWSALEQRYVSNAGYLALVNLDGDVVPEILAAQHDCSAAVDCASRPVFAQVFALTGQVLGCTRNYPKLDRLPGSPGVPLTKAQLTQCR